MSKLHIHVGTPSRVRTIWEGPETLKNRRFGRPIPARDEPLEGPLPERPSFSWMAFTADRTTRIGLPKKLPKTHLPNRCLLRSAISRFSQQEGGAPPVSSPYFHSPHRSHQTCRCFPLSAAWPLICLQYDR